MYSTIKLSFRICYFGLNFFKVLKKCIFIFTAVWLVHILSVNGNPASALLNYNTYEL